jgi:lipopolysaccharide export system protein LptA
METLREYLVNRFPDNPDGPSQPLLLIVGLILLLSLLCLPVAAAAPSAAGQPDSSGQKIRITADRLVADTKAGSGEFSGNVRAVQGATIITCDRLKILYDQNSAETTAAKTGASIKGIIATGNVIIHFDEKIATTEKAVYSSQTGIFILTGADTRVTSGDNSITGEKITVDRKRDKMTVESNAAKRVNAVIFTGQNGLATPAPNKDAAKDKSQ